MFQDVRSAMDNAGNNGTIILSVIRAIKGLLFLHVFHVSMAIKMMVISYVQYVHKFP